MDPNQSLRDVLELACRIISQSEPASEENHFDSEDAVQLAYKISELDTWLRKGGFLPCAWSAPRR